MTTMLSLLGGTENIEQEYQKCRTAIDRLKKLIQAKTGNLKLNALKTAASSKKKTKQAPHKDGLFDLRPSAEFKIRRKLPGHFGKIYALHWSVDNEQLLSASQDGKIIIWNTTTTNLRLAIPLTCAWVMTCAYSPCQRLVACGGLDDLCTVFNISDTSGWDMNRSYRELQRHEGYVSCCRFMNKNQIVSGSGDASLILWDIDKATALQQFCHFGDVQSLAINPANRSLFVSGSIDAMAKVWDIRQGHDSVATFQGNHTSDINCVEWFPDGKAFVSGSDDTSVLLNDLASYSQLNEYRDEGILASVTSVGFSRSGFFLLVGYDEEPFCLAWNTMTAAKEAQLEHPARCSCLQFSSDGHAIATGCWDRMLRVWA